MDKNGFEIVLGNLAWKAIEREGAIEDSDEHSDNLFNMLSRELKDYKSDISGLDQCEDLHDVCDLFGFGHGEWLDIFLGLFEKPIRIKRVCLDEGTIFYYKDKEGLGSYIENNYKIIEYESYYSR